MEEYQARIEAIGDQLRAKISSKFQTSTFLAGFAFTISGIQISGLWQSRAPQLLSVSIALLIVSIILYVCAIVKLDELTMPKRFWEEAATTENQNPRSAYLTDDNLWELRKRMIFYWTRLTLVATILTALSLLLMLLPFRPKNVEASEESVGLLWQTFSYTLIAVCVAAVYLAILIFVAKKRFNSLLRPVD